MSKKLELADYAATKTALLSAAGTELKVVKDEAGVVQRVELPRSAYLKIMEENGISKGLLEQTHATGAALSGAVMLLAADYAEEAVMAAKAAGNDPREVVAPKVVLRTVDGQLEARTKPYDTGRNPRTGDPTESFGRTGVKLVLSQSMRGGAEIDTHIRDTFTKLLGGAG